MSTKKGIETQKALVSAAIQLFYDKGYDEVSVKDICDSIDTPKSLFYYYYKDKLDLSTKVFRCFLREAYKLQSGVLRANPENEANISAFYLATIYSLMIDKNMLKLVCELVYAMPKFWLYGEGISHGASIYDSARRKMDKKEFEAYSSVIGAYPVFIRRWYDQQNKESDPEFFLRYIHRLELSAFLGGEDLDKAVDRDIKLALETPMNLKELYFSIPEKIADY